MEAKMVYELVHVGKEHTYRFLIPAGAPIGETYDAAFFVLNQLVKMAQEAQEKMKPSQKIEDAVSE